MLLQRRTTHHEMPTISYPIPQQDLSSPFPVDPISPISPRPFSPSPQNAFPSPISPQSTTRRLPTRQMSPKSRTNWLRGSQSHNKNESFSTSNKGHGHSASLSSVAPSRPAMRISEPKFMNALEIFSGPRIGALGSGATVVRTPQEALAGAAIQSFREEDEDEVQQHLVSAPDRHGSMETDSPPLPPLPIPKSPAADQTQQIVKMQRQDPPKPTRPPPPPPALTLDTSGSSISLYPPTPPHVSVGHQHSPLQSTCYNYPILQSMTLPIELPSTDITVLTPQPRFDAVLLSAVPPPAVDTRKAVITLETSTGSLKATLHTFASRPSHLATYLTSLFSPDVQAAEEEAEEDEGSVYSKNSGSQLAPPTPGSTAGAFNSLFHSHLASAGLIPVSSSSLHVFLDRPTAPYAHVLSYLRLPTSSPPTLPRALHLFPTVPARLEALLELRDEANYLGLEDLERLCTEELVFIQQASRHRSGTSGHLTHSRNASTASARTAFHDGHTHPHVRPEHGRGRTAVDTHVHSAGSLSSTETHVSGGAVISREYHVGYSNVANDTRSTRSASPVRTSVLGEIGVFKNTNERIAGSRSRSCSSARSHKGLEYPVKPPGSNAF